jgi:hypothetical protein
VPGANSMVPSKVRVKVDHSESDQTFLRSSGEQELRGVIAVERPLDTLRFDVLMKNELNTFRIAKLQYLLFGYAIDPKSTTEESINCYQILSKIDLYYGQSCIFYLTIIYLEALAGNVRLNAESGRCARNSTLR